MTTGAAYQEIQGKNPQTLGYGLTDSPAGLAGWIIEKFMVWTDNDGNPEDAVSRDAAAHQSHRLLGDEHDQLVDSPLLRVAAQRPNFGPTDDYVDGSDRARRCSRRRSSGAPRRTRKSRFNLVRYTRFDRGGHFAALEEPDLAGRQDVRRSSSGDLR